MTSLTLPIHIDAIRPLNSDEHSIITDGQGCITWMIMVPIIYPFFEQ